MTLTGEYSPTDTISGGSGSPTAFGITFTPTVIGAIVGVAGLLLSAYLGTQLVSPAYQKYQELKASVAEKEQTLEQQTEIVKQINQIVTKVNQAKAKNQEVRQLFSTQEALATLLLDLNRLIVERKAQLVTFKPEVASSGTVNDSSLGAELNGKMKRQVTNVSFQATFSQTLEVLQTIDRLQTLLVVRDLKTELSKDRTDTPGGSLTSSFKLYAYVPLSSEEIAAAAQKQAEAEAAAAEAKGKKKKKAK